MERKLAAILSADVKGYSRLMGEDEEATVRTLTEYRQVIADAVGRHRGRVVDTPGDNVLAEFASIVDAVRCAVETQADLGSRNAQLHPARRMEFRIGINLGDVIVDGPRIYGDGVNVAARVEGLAEPGGVTVSGAAFEQVEGKLPLRFEHAGDHTVKNIARPVRVYRVRPGPDDGAPVAPFPRAARPRRAAWLLPTAAALVVILLAGGYALFASLAARLSPGPEVAPVRLDPGRPSIAVLPFANIGGEAEREYLSDGITSDLITDLSKFPGVVVIASNTSFTYKGRAVDVAQVGRDLGVRYVLEGSVQPAGQRIRVNAQLVDAGTGRHLWAERYDRDAGDLLALQSEMIATIVSQMAPKIAESERARRLARDTANPRAYDAALRASHEARRQTRPANREARRLFLLALQEDPGFATAYAGLALTYYEDATWGWAEHYDEALRQAEKLARKALDLNDETALAHIALGRIYARQVRFEESIREHRMALSLEPNDAEGHRGLGLALLFSGRVEEALPWLESGHRLDPRASPGQVMVLGMALYLAARNTDAISILERAVAERADFYGNHVVLAAAYAREGRMDAARREAEIVRRLHPFFSLDTYGTQFRHARHRAALVDALRLAGLE